MQLKSSHTSTATILSSEIKNSMSAGENISIRPIMYLFVHLAWLVESENVGR
jgi:hypothetical protein